MTARSIGSGGEIDLVALATELFMPKPAVDPRDPDYSREGIFQTHNCWKCKDGAKSCVQGAPNRCEYPHARND